MENIVDMIWWPMVVALWPLNSSIIMHYIYEENFGLHFWIMITIYVLLSVNIGARLYLIEKRKDK